MQFARCLCLPDKQGTEAQDKIYGHSYLFEGETFTSEQAAQIARAVLRSYIGIGQLLVQHNNTELDDGSKFAVQQIAEDLEECASCDVFEVGLSNAPANYVATASIGRRREVLHIGRRPNKAR